MRESARGLTRRPPSNSNRKVKRVRGFQPQQLLGVLVSFQPDEADTHARLTRQLRSLSSSDIETIDT